MLDYHLHLWPHSEHETPLRLDQLAAYCERAQAAGVTELALTEHLFRFRQADALLGGFWDDPSVPPALAESMARYWKFHATADLDDPASMAEWSAREVDACWDAYTGAMEELAASRSCDVLAHPDLIKVMGHVPAAPAEWWDRIAEAAAASGMAAEVSSAGWRKPVGEQYPAAVTATGCPTRPR